MYLHKLPSEISMLTMYQFNYLLAQLGKRISWEIQLAALPAGAKPNDDYHPFTPTIERAEPKTLSNSESLGSFIGRLNTFGKGGG